MSTDPAGGDPPGPPTGDSSGPPTGDPSRSPMGEPSGPPTGDPSGSPMGEPSRESGDQAPAAPGEAAGREVVQLLADSPDHQSLRVSGPGLLVVSELLFPGWQVRVDGRAAPPVCADLALRAVVVGEGVHQVDWDYRPGWVVWAGLGLALGLVGLAAMARWGASCGSATSSHSPPV